MKDHQLRSWSTAFLWDRRDCDVNIRDPYRYFALMFPMTIIPTILSSTAAELRKSGKNEHFDREELLKYLGIRLTMAIERRKGSIAECWSIEKELDRTVLEPGRYGDRFGMPRNRFVDITAALRLCPFDDDKLKEVFEHYFHL